MVATYYRNCSQNILGWFDTNINLCEHCIGKIVYCTTNDNPFFVLFSFSWIWMVFWTGKENKEQGNLVGDVTLCPQKSWRIPLAYFKTS